MIATVRPSAPSASPSRIASLVLPVAVAPATTTRGGLAVVTRRWIRRRSCADERAPERVRTGVLDRDGYRPPDQGRVAIQVDELVATRPTGHADGRRIRNLRDLVVVAP